jgi:hypothetical protein
MDLDAELDSLVSSISTMGSKKPAAAAQKIQPAKNDNFDWPEEQPVSFTVDDMDSLLAEFEEAGPAKRRTAAKKPQIKRKGKYAEVSGAMQGNQLDSLLEDLDSQVASMDKTAGAKGTPKRTTCESLSKQKTCLLYWRMLRLSLSFALLVLHVTYQSDNS